MRLKDKVAIVTGAGRGIGKSIALALASEGSYLVLVARTEEQVRTVGNLAQERGVKALTLKADVSVEKDVKTVVQKAARTFGKIDILVNNAGILPETIRVPVAEISEKDWDSVLTTNLKGMFLFTKNVLPVMKAQNNGYILTVSSIMGRWGFTNLSSPYTASKFGICGLTETLFKEVKDTNIRVSMVCPGIVDTDFQTPARRKVVNPEDWLKPEDVAEGVIFLLTRPPNVIIPEMLIYPRAQFPQGRYY
jgi:NAD(P)-dependent dehydrogenase (short-subunit alcohol dehydrogenase family)